MAHKSIGKYWLVATTVFVGIVFATLYELGVILPSASYLGGYACIAQTDFFCDTPINMTTSGNLSLVVGQDIGHPTYNVGYGCVTYNGNATMFVSISNLTLMSGRPTSVTNLHCYNQNSSMVVNLTRGQHFIFWLWIRYTLNNTLPSSSNPYHTALITTAATVVTG